MSPHQRKISVLVKNQLAWFATNARDLPWRRTRDPYAIWVSEIMLQQTQVKTVIPYWDRWMRELPTTESLANAKPEAIHKLWEGLGYYTRVRNMQKAAQQIVSDCHSRGRDSVSLSSPKGGEGWGEEALSVHAELETLSRVRKTQRRQIQSTEIISLTGKFPNTFKEILDLPGIGRYTAGAICSIAFNQPTPILDGNVIRVLTRVFGIGENPKDKTANARLWHLAEKLVLGASRLPNHPAACSHLNQSLMELGALICTPRDPKCLVCPISKQCFAFQNNRVNEFPNLDKRPAATLRRYTALVIEHEGRFLVRQRPAGVVNAHLWEFPNVELMDASANLAAFAKTLLAFTPRNVKLLGIIKHSITRYRITVEVFYAQAPASMKIHHTPDPHNQWLTIPELHKLSFPSAHKRILKMLPL